MGRLLADRLGDLGGAEAAEAQLLVAPGASPGRKARRCVVLDQHGDHLGGGVGGGQVGPHQAGHRGWSASMAAWLRRCPATMRWPPSPSGITISGSSTPTDRIDATRGAIFVKGPAGGAVSRGGIPSWVVPDYYGRVSRGRRICALLEDSGWPAELLDRRRRRLPPRPGAGRVSAPRPSRAGTRSKGRRRSTPGRWPFFGPGRASVTCRRRPGISTCS